jgi:hypothetical protein
MCYINSRKRRYLFVRSSQILMSFRSRSHTKPVAPPRRRSSSLTRNATTSNSYQNARPLSIHVSSLGGNYSSQSNYYGSNQNLRMTGSDYYGNSGIADYRRNSYGSSLKFPITTMNSASSSSYVSPYKDRYSQNYYGNNSGSGGSSSYTSAYKDRVSSYYNPYTSYDNGVTTASLSFMPNSKRDYRNNLLSTSTGNLAGTSSNLINNNQSINEKVANIGRSQSLREHERKSRSRKYKEAAKAAVPDTQIPYDTSSTLLSSAQKSLSSLSLQSEGYEVIFTF